MSFLINKSEINLASAELLHQKNNYASVVHCAYYSCHQMMAHIWYHKLNKKDLVKSKEEGSHEALINCIGGFLKEKSFDLRGFNNSIGQLKKLRHKADYKNEEIDSTISNNSIQLSKSTLLILKKCL